MPKLLLLFIGVMFFTITLTGQKYLFLYDNAGNRISTNLTLKSGSLSNPSTTSKKEEFNARLQDLNLKLYPNPTKGLILLEISNFNKEYDLQYYLHDSAGNTLSKNNIYTSKTSLNLSAYPNGFYLLKLIYQKEIYTLKIIKK